MPCSMTGFARAEVKYDWGSLLWEIRSVNHRYLEAQFRLPESARALETELRELARQQLSRGKLDCVLTLNTSAQQSLEVNLELARQAVNAAEQIDDLLPESTPINPLQILQWPGVLQESSIDPDVFQTACTDLFAAALENMIESRQQEGGKLAEIIHQRLDGMEQQTAAVRDVLPDILQAQRDKLKNRLEELKSDLDPDRLEQEMVILAQKADVDEELDRLSTHIDEVRRTFKRKEPVGRRLDFLMQELNREANTLSSKSISTVTTQAGVEMKVLIEQMREQVQNIE